jgi:hypothetical protein
MQTSLDDFIKDRVNKLCKFFDWEEDSEQAAAVTQEMQEAYLIGVGYGAHNQTRSVNLVKNSVL